MPQPNGPTGLFTMRVIFGGLLASLAIYVGIGALLAAQLAQSAQPFTPLPPVFLIALTIVGVGILLGIPVVRRVLSKAPLSSSSLSGSAAPAMQRYFVVSIVSWALCESVGIFGLVLTMLSHEVFHVAGFAAVAALNMLIYRPSEAGLRALQQPQEPNT